MLDKMLAPTSASAAATDSTVPDVITLDLEDSVRTEKKAEARRMVTRALQTAPRTSRTRRFVRINPGQQGLDDLEAILTTDGLDGLLLPKVNSAEDVLAVSRFIDEHGSPDHKQNLRMIASIESPLGLLNMRQIVTASDKVGGLLFAAEDYCASSRIIRTPSRYEMLYARSSVVAVAHAYNLAAIDLVCVKYKGEEAEAILREESEEGRRLGFTGKQAIHPAQVSIIQKAFAPSDAEISRAQAILEQYEAARGSGAGAYGLKGSDGQTEMIDAPMGNFVAGPDQLLQAQGILASARAAGLI
ncbi:hypothetical protein C6P46_000691 [Rhodotorula mucilaginosa]|uniref:HpcH/HpaI aldolase/citrate lyase domain-containing protein n=1 Tax=Rhodotorula mucilaginosa TaxID=5537 RepID=A0A9P6VV11_RHOMI|nr:hypothetical protein C6P46_000691 [Rhodotorula mucilaginosa]TKA51623.1 hypothetical protein B0A53_05500 [Rhodotorula sp. CCFEE 5036]